eukprot:jgi/Tetstr1/450251/TSEL_037289.t1
MEINRPEEQQKAAVGAPLDALRGGKTQLPKIRSAITAEQIEGTRLPPADRPKLPNGQRPPRREEQAPQETTTTANININRPEEHHAAEPQVDRMRMLRKHGTRPKLEARPRLSAPPPKNYGRF